MFFLRESRSKEFILPFILLAILVSIVGIHLFSNVDFTLNADKYQAFVFGRDLAEGRFYQEHPLLHLYTDVLPEDKELPTGHVGTLYYNGKVFSKMDIGYPLILSVFYLLFGEMSFFYSCQIFLIGFLIIYYFTLRELLYAVRLRSYIALVSSIAVILLPNTILWVAGWQHRDIPALFFLFLSLFFFFRSLRVGKGFRPGMFLLSVFVFGLSCTIRLSNVIFILPIGIYFLLNLNRRLKFKKLVFLLLFSAILFNIALLPSYIQNLKTTGKLFTPPQHSEAQTILNAPDPGDPADATHPPLGYLIPKLPKIYEYFRMVYSIPGFLLIGIGSAASFLSWRKKSILFIAPIIAVAILGSFGKHFWARHMIFANTFIAPLFAIGIFALVDIVRSIRHEKTMNYAKKDVSTAVVLLVGILAVTIPPVIRTDYGKQVYGIDTDFFHLKDIPHLRAVFEKHIPPNAILLASYRLYENIDFYTRIRSIDAYQPLLWEGTNFKFGFGRILDNNIPLFFIDNMGYIDGRKWVPQIKDHFEMFPVATLSAKEARLRLKHHLGLKKCTLYKIERWKDKEVSLMFDPPSNRNYLLTLNMRQIFEDDSSHKAEIKLGGKIISESLRNGINYFLLPAPLFNRKESEFDFKDFFGFTVPLSYGNQTRFTISADVLMPKDIFVSKEPLQPYAFFNIGNRSEQTLSITKGMTSINTAFRRLKKYDEPASIRVPIICENDSTIGFKLTSRVLNLPPDFEHNPRIHFSLEGETFSSAELNKTQDWQTLFAILPKEMITSQTADLGIEIDKQDFRIIKESGAEPFFEFSGLKIEQWGKKISSIVPLSHSEMQFNRLVAFEATGLLLSEIVETNLQIEIGIKKDDIKASNGINWVLLPDLIFSIRSTGLNVSIINPDEKNGFLRWAGHIFIVEPVEIDVFSDDTHFVVSGFLNETQPSAKATRTRWTDGNALINIPSLYDDGMIIEIYVEPLPKTLDGLTTTVLWNGEKIGEIIASSESGKPYRFEISAEKLNPNFVIGGETEGEIHASSHKPTKLGNNILTLKTPTWKPSEKLGSADMRELGVQIKRILIKRNIE